MKGQLLVEQVTKMLEYLDPVTISLIYPTGLRLRWRIANVHFLLADGKVLIPNCDCTYQVVPSTGVKWLAVSRNDRGLASDGRQYRDIHIRTYRPIRREEYQGLGEFVLPIRKSF